MSQATVSVQAIAQFQLEQYLEQQSLESAQYEIDAVNEVFGRLYRVWGGTRGINLLGSFYQNLDGFWISQPCTAQRSSWVTDAEAIAAILNQ